MGYRSDVKVEIKIDGMTPQDILNEIEKTIKEEPKKLFNKIYVNNDKDSLILIGEYLKWYKTHSDVKSFENYLTNLINEIDDKEKEGFVYFVRIGEDMKDIEENFSNEAIWQTSLRIVREIEILSSDLKTIYGED